MSKSWIYRILVLVVVSALALSACAQATPTATPPPTDAPPTDEPTEEATEVIAQEPTQEATEIITEEPTEEAIEVMTEEPTEEATEIMTEEPTEEAVEVVTEEPTEEVTEEASTLPTIVEIVSSDEDLSILLAALEAADLVETLSGTGPFTVLAPTNEAFEAAFDALGVTEEDLFANAEQLTSILLYHVRSGELLAEGIAVRTRLRTLEGEFINVEVNDAGEIVLNGRVKITIQNIEAANGIVHVIDAVLVPEAAQ